MKRRAKVHTEDNHVAHEPSNQPFYHTERFWSITIGALLLLIALTTCITLRLATVDLDIADGWAENSVRQQGINQLAGMVRQQYPSLAENNVQNEAEKRWNEYAKQNAEVIEMQEAALAQELRAFFQFEAGTTKPYNQTYVLEMDPYLYWRHAVNYADHGYICDEGMEVLGDGMCHDTGRLAPTGTPVRIGLHAWFEAQLIKFVRLFNDNVHTLSIVFFVPVLLAALAVIPTFFIGRKFAGNLGGFIAAMLIAVHPVLMNRTIAGFADTDGYTYLFPLLTIWLLLEAIDAKRWWSRITLAALAGICVGLFAFAWGGWWFIFLVAVACFIVIILYTLAQNFKQHQAKSAYRNVIVPLALFGTFLLFSGLSVSLLDSPTAFFRSVTAPLSLASNLQAAVAVADLTGWPNILTTVAELNIPSLQQIVGNLGGKMVVVLAAFGLLVSMFNPRRLDLRTSLIAAAAIIYYFVLVNKGLGLSPITFLILFVLPLAAAIIYIFLSDTEANVALPLFLMGWLITVLFATTKGIRFLLLGIPPFAIGFAIAIGWVFIAITHSILGNRPKPAKMLATYAIAGVLILLLVFNPAAGYSPLKQGKYAADNQLPGMNDAWWQALTVIREQTPKDTIITSWWDFGHWFRNVGDRRVTFDGASQNPEPGHIVGKILLTNDEREALGLLRMIDCGHNNAFQVARPHMDVIVAKDLIDDLVLLDRAGARRRLVQTSLSAEDQAAILNNTHCEPPPAVFITSGDMIGKSGVWGHFGSWDFRKAMAHHYVNTLPQTEAIQKIESMNFTTAQATEMYYTIRAFPSEGQANNWISGWPNYFTQWQGCSVSNSTVTCPTSVGIGQTQQGLIVIEGVQFNASSPENMMIGYGAYNNNVRLGGNVGKPAKVVVADVATDELETYTNTSGEFAIGVLVRKEGDNYAVLLADPLQVDSMFTQLYFLDGVFTPHFTKLVETQELGGSRIIVWNVTWPKQ